MSFDFSPKELKDILNAQLDLALKNIRESSSAALGVVDVYKPDQEEITKMIREGDPSDMISTENLYREAQLKGQVEKFIHNVKLLQSIAETTGLIKTIQ